jgi:hypothetical protein
VLTAHPLWDVSCELAHCCYPANPKKLCAYARLRNGGVPSQKKIASWTFGHLDMFKNEDGSNKSNSDSWIFIHPNMLCIHPKPLGHPAVLPKWIRA